MLSLYVGYVVESKDEYDAGRIKAVISEDKGTPVSNIPYAFPAIPKLIHIKPKVNEAVIVLVSNDKEANGQRLYIGPIISQPDKMGYDNFFTFSPTRFLSGGVKPPAIPVSNRGTADGAMPKDEEIGILGRKNTDIILSDDDVRIRAGVRLTKPNEETVKFNRDAPAFIKLKHHDPPLKTEKKNDNGVGNQHTETRSTATIVADKINLITQNSDESFGLSDKNEGINDKQMADILERAHKLPYGDVLCDFFQTFMNMYFSHYHAYPGLPPVTDGDPTSTVFIEKYGTLDKMHDKLLSKDINIS